MRLGMVGLGRMGANMAERLRRGSHDVIGFDADPAVTEVGSLDELVADLPAPRIVWMMVPAGPPTEQTVAGLVALLGDGDIVVDGGNANFRDSMRRAMTLADRGIVFCDAGVSGGVWGLEDGYSLMVGATSEAFAAIEPVLATLAPPQGYARVGPPGAGHFVKMIHNGIEYGLMQAYAEGFELLEASPDFDLDLSQVAEVWRHGSLVRSWLLDLAARALAADPALEQLRGYVEDGGEGRWTVEQAIDTAVPAPVITAALYARFASREDDSFAMRMVAALRREFGGHAVKG